MQGGFRGFLGRPRSKIPYGEKRHASKVEAKHSHLLLTVVGFVAKAEARTVNVAVPTLSMVVIAFTAAKEKGYYQEEGLDVNLVVMRDTLGISALIGGNADFASMSGAGLTAILGGVPLRFVFSSFFRPMFWLYAKPEFQDIKALKGKRIGVTGLGSGPDNLLRETLKRNGIEGGRDATILALGLPSTVATALRTGTVDAGTISPPFNFVVKDAGLSRAGVIPERRFRRAARKHSDA